MYILHLSDLHFGTTDNANRWQSQLAEDLRYGLNCEHLDALLISGDIANKSTTEEYAAAKEFLDNLREEFPINQENIVIVPGNHDLNWGLSEDAYTPVKRKNYPGQLDNRIIDKGGDYIEVRNEEKYQHRFDYFSKFYEDIKGEPYPLRDDQQGILYPLTEQKILFLGLNSAWQLDHNDTRSASINPNALSNALTKIRRNTEYNNCLKIAVWHHPLNSNSEDRIKDHGFMEQLAKAGFRLALHGHIHQADNSLYRYDRSVGGRKIEVISAGTFGANTSELVTAYPWQYQILKLENENRKLTVYTRKREKANGAWKPDGRWTTGDEMTTLAYYEVLLNP
ncbi:MAG: metallophosphoesterase [Gloeotrichia echinulata DEX184]|nr:metallophosphoesterase [Gloeotrichia echinulata DEX184]